MSSLPPGIFNSLINLTYLDLDTNQLTSLPAGVFDSLTSLKNLNINYNELTSLHVGAFDALTNLISLDLGGNQLTTLPDGIFNLLTNLGSLHIENNQLTSLPAGIFDTLTNLNALYVYNNPITSFPVGIFDYLSNLNTVYISPACNTAGTETISYPLDYMYGSVNTDNGYCVALPDTNPADFTGELEAKGYTRNGTYNSYVGNMSISFNNPSTSNQFLEAVAMESTDTNPAVVSFQN